MPSALDTTLTTVHFTLTHTHTHTHTHRCACTEATGGDFETPTGTFIDYTVSCWIQWNKIVPFSSQDKLTAQYENGLGLHPADRTKAQLKPCTRWPHTHTHKKKPSRQNQHKFTPEKQDYTHRGKTTTLLQTLENNGHAKLSRKHTRIHKMCKTEVGTTTADTDRMEMHMKRSQHEVHIMDHSLVFFKSVNA